ncbi:MAG TPA: calcium-binding protein, partial [Pirellulaceae bacterium]|nr:calcium-binding protein [Pirellulaceae bacterium]
MRFDGTIYYGTLGGAHHGQDTLDGGEGDDSLIGGGDDDILSGGAGDDSLVGDVAVNFVLAADFQGDDFLDGGAGDDGLWGNGGDDTLLGGSDFDELQGDAGNDVLVGGAGDDDLLAGEGNDILFGGSGCDYLAGGDGDDTYLLNIGDGERTGTGLIEAIVDEDGLNTVRFVGSDTSTVAVARANLLDLWIRYGADDQVVILDGLRATNTSFAFEDETLDLGQLTGRYLSEPTSYTLPDGSSVGLGGFGDDILTATGSSAVLSGGRGNDRLVASATHNVIRYSLGDGSDHVEGTADTVLRFGPGIAVGDLTLRLGSLAIAIGSDPRDV